MLLTKTEKDKQVPLCLHVEEEYGIIWIAFLAYAVQMRWIRFTV
jgi:hypothetical protein